jgi:RNA polymerase sigma-70 factor (sigma-E family)
VAEPDGFRAYVEARQHALLGTAWLLTGDWQHAEDLVQTALAKVWPRWDRIVAKGDPDGYVRRAVVTSYLTWRRRRWHGERPSETFPETASGQDEYVAADLRTAFGRLLPELAPRQRTIVVLRFYEDLSVEQVASLMGCSVGTVKSQTAKALARLRVAVETEGIR